VPNCASPLVAAAIRAALKPASLLEELEIPPARSAFPARRYRPAGDKRLSGRYLRTCFRGRSGNYNNRSDLTASDYCERRDSTPVSPRQPRPAERAENLSGLHLPHVEQGVETD